MREIGSRSLGPYHLLYRQRGYGYNESDPLTYCFSSLLHGVCYRLIVRYPPDTSVLGTLGMTYLHVGPMRASFALAFGPIAGWDRIYGRCGYLWPTYLIEAPV